MAVAVNLVREPNARPTPNVADNNLSEIGTLGGSNGGTGKGGSFYDVWKQIKPAELASGASFNPTPPSVQYRALQEATKYRPNELGFLVRDPVFMSQVNPMASGWQGAKTESWRHWSKNYGFRFLYNPTEFSEALVAPATGDPMKILSDVQEVGVPESLDTGSGIALNLLLYRGEDLRLLQSNDYQSFYPNEKLQPGEWEEMRKGILERGTQFDLEYLFRMCNGDPLTTWHGSTADWGMLLPTLLVLSMGNSVGSRRIRGRITNLAWTHRLFATGMVPILTEVSVQFARQSDGYYKQVKEEATSGGEGSPNPNGEVVSGNVGNVGNEAVTAPVFSGTMRTHRTGRTPQQAVAWLYKHLGMGGVSNACLRLADDAYNPSGSRLPRAIDQWYRAKKHGYAHPKDKNPPPGAQVFWWSSNDARHIATAVGDGYIISNVGDTVQKKKFSYFNGYGPYLGWAEPYY